MGFNAKGKPGYYLIIKSISYLAKKFEFLSFDE